MFEYTKASIERGLSALEHIFSQLRVLNAQLGVKNLADDAVLKLAGENFRTNRQILTEIAGLNAHIQAYLKAVDVYPNANPTPSVSFTDPEATEILEKIQSRARRPLNDDEIANIMAELNETL